MLSIRYVRIVALAACCVAVCCVAATHAEIRTAEQVTKVIDGFLDEVKANASFPAEVVQKAGDATTALKNSDDGRTLAITEGLRELYPAFREALQAMGEEKLDAASVSLRDLVGSSDKYLAAEASYFLARTYLLQERYEEAMPLLEAMETNYEQFSVRTGEAVFLKGIAQVQTLQRKEAIVSLQRYLNENPAAPERMKIGAWRQLEQLRMVDEGTLSDVFGRMEFSRRRLALQDSGQDTRGEQKKIVSILEKLIKEAEAKESSGKGSGKGQKKGEKQGKPGEGEGEGDSQGKGGQGGQTGGGSRGIDSAAAERLHRGGPQSPWSQLRDRERDPVYSAIKEKFPGRYQQLIEQYYKSFQEVGDEP